MSLLKCPKCGEMFSDSYKTCPFCEEDEAFANGGKKPVNPGRRVHRQKSPSILGPTLVLVLVLVAGVLLYTLIGGRKTGDDQPDPPTTPTVDVDKPTTPTVKLTLDQTALELTAGGTGKLAATGADQITWTSSNADVATVDEDGTVTAVAAGTATISASAEGADPVTCTVTVKEAPKKDLVLESIWGVKGASIDIGEEATMRVTADGETVDDSLIKWSTANPSIATVDASGVVKGVASGSTDLIAEVYGQTLTVTVIVE